MAKKILLVEDDQTISWIYKTKFESEGYVVALAMNGADALVLAKQEKPDIILLDVIIPQLDGFTVLEELKKDDTTKNVPVIMLTNLGTDEDREKGKTMGAVDYLVKANLTPMEVSDSVKKYLSN